MANVELGKGDGEEQARTLSWDEGTSSEGESLPQSVAQAVERLDKMGQYVADDYVSAPIAGAPS